MVLPAEAVSLPDSASQPNGGIYAIRSKAACC
jgi:hypothetical protein